MKNKGELIYRNRIKLLLSGLHVQGAIELSCGVGYFGPRGDLLLQDCQGATVSLLGRDPVFPGV